MNVQFMARAFRCRNSTSRAAEEARISGCTDQAREEVRKQRGIPIAALAWTRFLVFLDRESGEHEEGGYLISRVIVRRGLLAAIVLILVGSILCAGAAPKLTESHTWHPCRRCIVLRSDSS